MPCSGQFRTKAETLKLARRPRGVYLPSVREVEAAISSDISFLLSLVSLNAH